MALDKGDPIVRERLIQKLLLLVEDVGGASRPPTDADLRAYFDATRAQWRRPERVHFVHVFATTKAKLPGLARGAATGGANPFQFGFVGGTDDHNGTPGNTRETTWPGHAGRADDTPEKRIAPPGGGGLGVRVGHNPGGLAVAWAEQNTRDFVVRRVPPPRDVRDERHAHPRALLRDVEQRRSVLRPELPVRARRLGSRADGRQLRRGDAGRFGRTSLRRVRVEGQGGPRAHRRREALVRRRGRAARERRPRRRTGRSGQRTLLGDCAAAPGVAPTSCADGGALNTMSQERAWTSPIWYQP